METRKVVALLEKVKDNLGVVDGEQKKASQNNKVSTAAAKAKLAELNKKLKASRSSDNEIKATGAGK